MARCHAPRGSAPGSRPGPDTGARPRTATAAIVIGALLASGCTDPVAGPTSDASAPVTAAPQTGDGVAAERAAVAEAALTAHLRAAGVGDLAAFLAPVRGAALRADQRAVFDRMQLIGLSDLRLGVVTETSHDATGWSVHALATYRIAGHDRTPRSFEFNASLRLTNPTGTGPHRRPHHQASRSPPGNRRGDRNRGTSPALSCAGPLTRSSSPSEPTGPTRSRASRARPAVTSPRSGVPPVSAVWVAPQEDATAGRVLGEDVGSLAGVAGVTDGPLEEGEPAGADRIVVVPGAWDSLTEQGRSVVMTHELTHASVRATTTRPVPLWLSEGFAEYVAYRTVDLDESVVAGPALRRFAAEGLPTDLPVAADFTAGAALAGAYAASLLAARTLADTRGQADLVRVYSEVAAPGAAGGTAAALTDADARLDAVLVTTASLTRPHSCGGGAHGSRRSSADEGGGCATPPPGVAVTRTGSPPASANSLRTTAALEA